MAELGQRIRRPPLLFRLLRPARRPAQPLPLWELQAATSPRVQTLLRQRAGGLAMRDGVLCRILSRYKLFVDAADITHAPHLVMDGCWEPWTTAFLARNLGRGETVVDGGACYGYFSLLMADLIGPGGKLLAFEPNPRLHALLERNLRLNGMVSISRSLPMALAGRTSAGMRFRAFADSPMNSHVLPADLQGGEAAPGGALPEGMQRVATVTLDSLAGAPVHFIKLDICGAEEAAWGGARRLLEGNPAIRLLVTFNACRCLAPAELLGQMQQHFPLRRLDHDGHARPVAAEALLDGEDVQLYLAKAAPR